MRPVIYFNPIALPKTKHYVPLWNRQVVYPKFTPGDPQLRMFLPPFWMKLIYPGKSCPKSVAVFKVHPQMTRYDVRQYLEKIYKVPVSGVTLKMLHHDLAPTDISEKKQSIIGIRFPHLLPREPERYEKVAYIRLAPGYTFEFPNIFGDRRPSDEIERLSRGEAAEHRPTEEDKGVKAKEVTTKEKRIESLPGSGIPKWFS